MVPLSSLFPAISPADSAGTIKRQSPNALPTRAKEFVVPLRCSAGSKGGARGEGLAAAPFPWQP